MNDNAPVFSCDPYHITVSESAGPHHSLVQLMVTDQDLQLPTKPLELSLGAGMQVSGVVPVEGCPKVCQIVAFRAKLTHFGPKSELPGSEVVLLVFPYIMSVCEYVNL